MTNFAIVCGDAIELMRSVPDASVDLVDTDTAYESLEKHRKIGTTTRLKKSDASSNEWFELFRNDRFPEFFEQAYRVLRRDRHLYFFCDRETEHVAVPIAEAAGFKWWNSLVWVKTKGLTTANSLDESNIKITLGYHYRRSNELIVFFEKGKRKLNDLSIPDTLPCPPVHRGYPTEKPVDLHKVLIGQSTLPGEIVLDPFMGCYDEETEVLTRRGWSRFSVIEKTDEFLTRDADGTLVYQRPSTIIKQDYAGEMVRIKARSTDLLVTPDHNMLVQSHADFCAGRSAQLLRADALTQSTYRIPCGGTYDPPARTLSRDMMYLLGLYVSEGYPASNGSMDIVICQNAGTKRNKMMEWMRSRKPRSHGDRRFVVRVTKTEMDFILANCGKTAYGKFLSPTILNNQHLDALFDAMMLGDGSVSKDGQKQYYTTSSRLADGFQELALKLGWDSTLLVRAVRKPSRMNDGRVVSGKVPQLVVCVRRAKSKKIIPLRHMTRVHYDGCVYCVTVPNHTLFVRRNGLTSWCGNSGSAGNAAVRLGRAFIGGDIKESAVALARQRLLGAGGKEQSVQFVLGAATPPTPPTIMQPGLPDDGPAAFAKDYIPDDDINPDDLV